METLKDWVVTEKGLVREFKFDNFKLAMKFINSVADIADHMNHHPDIYNSYDKVTLTLFSHDTGEITEKDYQLAEAINAL